MPKSVDAATGTIHLRYVGRVPAVPAQELKVGDQLMYNYGDVCQISRIENASPQFLRIHQVDTETGREHNRRVHKNRLMARVRVPDRRRLGHDAPISHYRAQVYAPHAQTWTTVSHGATLEAAVEGRTPRGKFPYFASVLLDDHGLGGTFEARAASMNAMSHGETLTAQDGHRFRILPPQPAPAQLAAPATVAPDGGLHAPPHTTPAEPQVTVTVGYTRKSIPTRLREAGVPGRTVYSTKAGALRWRLPDGEELTPGQAEQRFLTD